MVRFQDLIMSNEAANKWANSAIDTQIVIKIAFYDILKRPELVADYADLNITTGDISIELFRFKIGYVIFVLMMMQGFDEFIVLDFDVQDGDSAHVEHSVAALPLPTPAPP